MELKYILKVFFAVVFIFSFAGLIIMLNLMSKTTEGFDDTPITIDKSAAFCEIHRGSSGALDDACGALTTTNCKSTSCCVWTSEDKCVAGGQGGPTFNSDAKGKTKQLDYYYFENKCYGDKCP
jgi:hypothetical protein